jgi:hypothetical protein
MNKKLLKSRPMYIQKDTIFRWVVGLTKELEKFRGGDSLPKGMRGNRPSL